MYGRVIRGLAQVDGLVLSRARERRASNLDEYYGWIAGDGGGGG